MKQQPQLHPRTLNVTAVKTIDNTSQLQGQTKNKRRGNPKWKKGVSGNPAGKPKGSKDKTTVLREAILKNAPDLSAKMIDAAKAGNIQALLSVLNPLMPQGKWSGGWKLGDVDTPEEIVAASKRILRAVEDGKLTLDEGHKQQDLLDKHASKVTAGATGDRRSEFEEEQIALALIRNDPECRQLAQQLVSRFDELEQAALTDGRLTAPAQHKLIEVARAGSKP